MVGDFVVDPTCALNPYFEQFQLAGEDPPVFNNHFPLQRQAGPRVPAPAISNGALLTALILLCLVAFFALRRFELSVPRD